MRFVDGLDLAGFLGDDKAFYAATRCSKSFPKPLVG
jgi:hypothetical protein